ncbi:sulfatase-like hydrolase/transferase [Rhodopirellula sallentina]|nr:sulfatase-like hydrolase/transferase [Rhodopirellula sallentina]
MIRAFNATRFAAMLTLLLCLTHDTAADEPTHTKRPNFLFIAIDDLNDFSGYMADEPGNFLQTIYPDARVRAKVCQRLTPNLDRFAKQSAPFLRAYCPSALCGPSRTSLMTGVPPCRSGYYTHTRHFRTYETLKDAVTLPQRLKQNGYYTTGLGKLFHKSVGDANGPIKNDWADARYSWSSWINHASGCNGGRPSKYSPINGGNMVFGPSRLTTQESGDWMTADFAARLLETGTAEIRNDKKRGKVGPDSVTLPNDQPFFLGCGLFRPHLPFFAPQKFFDLFPTDEMTGLNRSSLDAIVADLDDLPSGAQRFSDFGSGKMKVVMEHARSVGGVKAEVPAWREMVQSYLACVAFADACLGRLLEGYERSPYHDNTVVFLWSDHGYHLGTKYHVAKQALWEEANRVQFIVHDPRSPGSRDGKPRRQLVSLNDLYPTICVMADTGVPPTLEAGKDIASLIENADAPPVHPHLLMTYMEGNHSLRTSTHKLNRYNDNSIELYNMVNDPFQVTNLAGKEQTRALQQELQNRLNEAIATRPKQSPQEQRSSHPADDTLSQNNRTETENNDRQAIHLLGSEWMRDPYVVLHPDGHYYMTSTRLGHTTGGVQGIEVWKSSDLSNWKRLGVPWTFDESSWINTLAPVIDSQKDFWLWAPELHFTGNRWVAIHTTNRRVSNLLVSKAKGQALESGFREPMEVSFGHRHDPFLFADDDGSNWLVWACAKVVKLEADFSGFDGDEFTIGPSDRKLGHEGCSIRKIGKKYVLFGTAWSKDELRQGTYNLYYCTADRVTGPYGPRRFAGRFCGHGTPFQDKTGQWWTTAFRNGKLEKDIQRGQSLCDNGKAWTYNAQGMTLVPLEVSQTNNGDISVRAIPDPYASPGPEEVQSFSPAPRNDTASM